jgi:hypothetical protein
MEMLDFFHVMGNYCIKLLLGGTGRSKNLFPKGTPGGVL